MPAALKRDWGAAKALYIAGVDYEPICKELEIPYQTLRKRVERGKWSEERDKAKRLVSSQAGKEDDVSKNVTKALVGTFQAWKESAINDVAQAGAAIAQNLRKIASDPSATYETQAAAFEGFEPAARVLKPFLGLNDNTNINVGVQINALTEVPEMESFELPK